MKTYTITLPSLDGLLSDDNLYFEGINRPSEVYRFRDGNESPEDMVVVLEKYFNDVYNLFLRKLSTYAMFDKTDLEEELKMQALLQELIKVKKLIIKGNLKEEE